MSVWQKHVLSGSKSVKFSKVMLKEQYLRIHEFKFIYNQVIIYQPI